MGTVCIFCQKEIGNGASVMKLVQGTNYKGQYGGFKFTEKGEFSTQGFIHFECFYKAVSASRVNATK